MMANLRLSRRSFLVGAGALLTPATGRSASPRLHLAGRKLEDIRVRARDLGVRALVVLHNGEPVLSDGDVDAPLRTASIRKSILSALFGMTISARQKLDTSIRDLGIDDYEPLTPEEQGATVRQLMMARSGIYLPAAAESDAMRASRPPRGSHAPGTFWYYNNWDFNALGEIYQRITGESFFVAVEHRLARPLGFRDYESLRDGEWDYDLTAPRFPAYSLKMSARDLASFGQLFLSRGLWRGDQIVPESWIEESTRAHSLTGRCGFETGYGYMWWVATDRGSQPTRCVPVGTHTAAGNGGRYLSIIPSSNAVVAIQPHEEPGKPAARIYTQKGAYTMLLRRLVDAIG